MSDITMIDPQRFSRTHSDLFWHSDLFGLFNAELARADAITGLVDAGRALWPRFATFYHGLARLPRKARRALQRRWRRSLGGIALLCALGQVPAALAAQIDVGGACTLVDAITAANNNEPMGGCPAGSGADTITLPVGSTQTLAPVEPYYGFYGPTGLPVITSAIVIDGNGSTIARDPQAPEFRILAVDPAGDLVLQETTVTGGVILSFDGGGIFNGGTLTLAHSTVISSSTVSGYSAAGGSGGGIFNSSSGTLTLTNSTISGNSARYGGGVKNYGTLTLSSSTVSGNSASSDGGGVSNSGTLTLTNSTVSGNSAGSGGGGLRNSGTLTLVNSTVSDNSAAASGGGVYSFGTLALTNSTVSGNSAGFRGGGVHNDGTSTLTNSTVSGNSADFRGGGVHNDRTLTLTNSTVSGNTASSQGPEVYNYDGVEGSGTINASDFNLFGHDGSSGVTGFTPGVTDIVPSVSLSAILDPALADNGGPTRTHALVSGSPAIDAIPAPSCATIGDQRGVTRPQDGDEDTNADCDIGAFELQLPPSPTITTTPTHTKLLPSEATVEQNPKVQCFGSDCRVRVKCDAVQGSIEPCDARIDVFVRASALRLDEGGATRARRRIRFAGAVTNIPPGEIANLPLRLTKRGRRIVRAGLNRRLRGVMEIRNSIGPVQTVRVRLRLRLRR